MGYRLHYAQKHQVQWEGGFFNWNSDIFADLVSGELKDAWVSENLEEIELYPEDVKKYLAKIKRHPRKKNKYMTDYTNKEVAEALQEMLDNYDKSNDYIRLCWF